MATARLILPIPHKTFIEKEHSSVTSIFTSGLSTQPIRRRSSRQPRPVKRFESQERQTQNIPRENNQAISDLSAHWKTIKQQKSAVEIPQNAVSSHPRESTKPKQLAKRKWSPEDTPSQEPMTESRPQAEENSLEQIATLSRCSQSSPSTNEQHLSLGQPRKSSSSPSIPSRKKRRQPARKLGSLEDCSSSQPETKRPRRSNIDSGKVPTKNINTTQTANNKQTSRKPATRRSSPRTTNNLATSCKSKERKAFEAHLRTHDSFGVIRFESNDPVAPANHREHLARIEGMFRHEPLMSRLQTAWEQRRQRNTSDKKLWELGKKMPWVLDRFKTVEEYQQWIMEAKRRQERWRQDEDRRKGLEDHSGDTTEEEEEEQPEDWDGVTREETGPVSFIRIQSRRQFKTRHCQAQRVGANVQTELYGQVGTARLSALADICCRETGYPN